MRGIKYQMKFTLPTGEVNDVSGLDARQLVDKIHELFQTHYNYDYSPNINSIYNLNRRPNNTNRFVRERVNICRCPKT